jgi:hypothetical protein
LRDVHVGSDVALTRGAATVSCRQQEAESAKTREGELGDAFFSVVKEALELQKHAQRNS